MYFKLGVVGGVLYRFPDPTLARTALFDTLDERIKQDILKDRDCEIEIVSGASDEDGVDTWAREYAHERGYALKEFPPQFDLYDRPKVYHVRNIELAKYVAWCWGFLGPNQSDHPKARSGTLMTIRHSTKHQASVKVFKLVEDKFKLSWEKQSWFEGWQEHIRRQMFK